MFNILPDFDAGKAVTKRERPDQCVDLRVKSIGLKDILYALQPHQRFADPTGYKGTADVTPSYAVR